MAKRTCSAEENGERCGEPHSAHGYCGFHDKRFQKYGDPAAGGLHRIRTKGRGCGFIAENGERCSNPHATRGYCAGHAAQLQRGVELGPLRAYGGGKCSIKGCPEPLLARGWCDFHYGRCYRYGDPLGTPPVREPRQVQECLFGGCENERWTQDYCRGHTRQLGKGQELRPLRPQRLYAIDHTFFNVIDTEAKAYWLGFITADGCIVRKNSVAINLAAVDGDHLLKLNESLSADYPVKYGPSSKSPNGMARWCANSMPIVDALVALGVTPRKSVNATLEPWDGPAHLMPHYWRGMVDGDGGMSLFRIRRSRPKDQWRIYLTGTRPCVEAFAHWASAICGSRAQLRLNGNSKTCWFWMVGGNRMTPLVVRELYGNCSVSLDRKQALADTILAANPHLLAA